MNLFTEHQVSLGTKEMRYNPCRNAECKSRDLKAEVILNYIKALGFMPIPFTKELKVHCGNCRRTYNESSLGPMDHDSEWTFVKSDFKVPLRYYYGLLIGAVVFTGFVFLGDWQDRMSNNSNLSRLEKGHIVVLENNGYFTSFLADSVSSDTIWFKSNKRVMKEIKNISEIQVDSLYLASIMRISTEELKEMNRNGEVSHVIH